MADKTKLRGRWGEALAADYLRKKGYTIAAMGWHTRFGELDIVAENRDTLAFVEVKLRKNADFAAAREFVDRRKREKLIASAGLYLAEHETDKQPRFDVVEIYAPDGVGTKNPTLHYIENAFGVET
ncbi:MAG: YraN family protein [Oscillospiraceae bacterium]|nr:YraN family protein [Oscillospiraceae bacterium]